MRSLYTVLLTACFLTTGCCIFKNGAAYEREFLFDGKSLAGWKASEEGANAFTVADGEIQIRGGRGHLYYVGPDGGAEFKNFELSA
ncbi:MAG TPA: DUF1080 domain-containing protein, partial [Opitutae bacterium]|nr:DUF1080 domain-containing protein [Opitutae bacterium]